MATELPHQLSLKVMRLAKPSLASSLPFSVEQSDVGGHVERLTRERFGVGGALKLAAVFGEIYLGETFTCYLTVRNFSAQPVSQVVIKAELQTASKRYILKSLENAPIASLAGNASVDSILQRVVRDEGVHILVCSAAYVDSNGERRYFRKFFKFNVAQPFAMSHKQYRLRHGEGNLFLETEIANNTSLTLCLTRVAYIARPPWCEAQHSPAKQQLGAGKTEDGTYYLMPSCSLRLLHIVTRAAEEAAATEGVESGGLGFLEVTWSRGWGEKGTIRSPELVHKPPPAQLVEVKLINVPSAGIVAGDTYTVRCRVINTHHYDSRRLRVVLDVSDSATVLLLGSSGFVLPKLGPKQHAEFDLKLVGVALGLQTIGGLKLEDAESDKQWRFDSLSTVLVLATSSKGGGQSSRGEKEGADSVGNAGGNDGSSARDNADGNGNNNAAAAAAADKATHDAIVVAASDASATAAEVDIGVDGEFVANVEDENIAKDEHGADGEGVAESGEHGDDPAVAEESNADDSSAAAAAAVAVERSVSADVTGEDEPEEEAEQSDALTQASPQQEAQNDEQAELLATTAHEIVTEDDNEGPVEDGGVVEPNE